MVREQTLADRSHTVARQLRTIRARLGLQQRELADSASISSAYLSQIETGKKQPSMEVLQRLAAALDVTPAVLLDEGPYDAGAQGVDTIRAGAAEAPSTRAVEPPSLRETSPTSMRSREDLELALRSHTAVSSIVSEARHALDDGLRASLGPWAAVADDCCRLLRAFASDSYRAVPWDALILITAALTYLAEPDDIAPEHHIDDMAVLAFTDSLVRPDLEAFRDWERRR